MKYRMWVVVAAALLGLTANVTIANSVTGNPDADGWSSFGHSLQQGTYVTGPGNYGYQTYGAALTVAPGSNLQIADGTYSWLAGDTVLGVGGKFESISSADAGWTVPANINGLLPTAAPYSGPKLQAKFGTSAATWSTSTVAPGAGNGNSSSSAGGGRVQVRTSGYFQTGTPTSGQTEPWTWDGNSGQLLKLDKESHVAWAGDAALDKRVARMVWIWNDTIKRIDSWQLLLNASLLDRVAPVSFSGLLPGAGDKAIMTVQNGDSGSYTDALVTLAPAQAVPLPAAAWMGLALLGGAGGFRSLRNRLRPRTA